MSTPIKRILWAIDHVECPHGAFSRSFPVPGNVDIGAITATYHEGVLQVVVPRAATPPTHVVPVKEIPHALAAPSTDAWELEDEDCDTCLG